MSQFKVLNVLKESQLLCDYIASDPDLDRYTSLCCRLFKVPTSVISIICENEILLKSVAGNFPFPVVDKAASLFHYNIQIASPEALIVLDASVDSRFNDHVLVKGFPWVKFYAGISLEIDGVRIGSLSLMDYSPRPQFDDANIRTFADIACALNAFIVSNRRANLSMRTAIYQITNNIRKPISSIGLFSSKIGEYLSRSRLSHLPVFDGDAVEWESLIDCSRELKRSFLTLAQTIEDANLITKSSDPFNRESFADGLNSSRFCDAKRRFYCAKTCDILNVLTSIQSNVLEQRTTSLSNKAIQWDISKLHDLHTFLQQSPTKSHYLTYPDVIYSILISKLEFLSSSYEYVKVVVSYDADVTVTPYGMDTHSSQSNASKKGISPYPGAPPSILLEESERSPSGAASGIVPDNYNHTMHSDRSSVAPSRKNDDAAAPPSAQHSYDIASNGEAHLDYDDTVAMCAVDLDQRGGEGEGAERESHAKGRATDSAHSASGVLVVSVYYSTVRVDHERQSRRTATFLARQGTWGGQQRHQQQSAVQSSTSPSRAPPPGAAATALPTASCPSGEYSHAVRGAIGRARQAEVDATEDMAVSTSSSGLSYGPVSSSSSSGERNNDQIPIESPDFSGREASRYESMLSLASFLFPDLEAKRLLGEIGGVLCEGEAADVPFVQYVFPSHIIAGGAVADDHNNPTATSDVPSGTNQMSDFWLDGLSEEEVNEINCHRRSPVSQAAERVTSSEVKLEEGAVEGSTVSKELLSSKSPPLFSVADAQNPHSRESSPVDVTASESPARVMAEGSEEVKLNNIRSNSTRSDSTRSGGDGGHLNIHVALSSSDLDCSRDDLDVDRTCQGGSKVYPGHVESFFHNSRNNSINQHGRRSLVIHEINVDLLNENGTVTKVVSHDIAGRKKDSGDEAIIAGNVSDGNKADPPKSPLGKKNDELTLKKASVREVIVTGSRSRTNLQSLSLSESGAATVAGDLDVENELESPVSKRPSSRGSRAGSVASQCGEDSSRPSSIRSFLRRRSDTVGIEVVEDDILNRSPNSQYQNKRLSYSDVDADNDQGSSVAGSECEVSSNASGTGYFSLLQLGHVFSFPNKQIGLSSSTVGILPKEFSWESSATSDSSVGVNGEKSSARSRGGGKSHSRQRKKVMRSQDSEEIPEGRTATQPLSLRYSHRNANSSTNLQDSSLVGHVVPHRDSSSTVATESTFCGVRGGAAGSSSGSYKSKSVGSQRDSGGAGGHGAGAVRTNVRVLLVDDTVSIQRVMRRWLETEHCEVTVASNGLEAVTALQTKVFDLCFMDFMMPVMNGLEALRTFYYWRKSDSENSINNNILVVGMSANAPGTEQDEAFSFGMHFFATKPVEIEYLTWVVEEVRKHPHRDRAFDALQLRMAMSLEDDRLHAAAGTLRCSTTHRKSINTTYDTSPRPSSALSKSKLINLPRSHSSIEPSEGSSVHSGTAEEQKGRQMNYQKSVSAGAELVNAHIAPFRSQRSESSLLRSPTASRLLDSDLAERGVGLVGDEEFLNEDNVWEDAARSGVQQRAPTCNTKHNPNNNHNMDMDHDSAVPGRVQNRSWFSCWLCS